MDQIEEVKQAIDIVQLIGEYVPLKKSGHNYKGLCPFHGEKTPSFMVNPELGIFKCFGCGAGGDAISFLQRIEGMEFGEALKTLAERAGIKLTSYKPTEAETSKDRLIQINELASAAYHYLLTSHKLGLPAKLYLESRKISLESVEKFQLGYAPDSWDFIYTFLTSKKQVKEEELVRAGLIIAGKRYDRFRNRLIFPLKNNRGQTVGFTGRVLPGADEKSGGKYVNTSETEIYHKSELLYGLNVTRSEIKKAGFAVAVEGQMDVIPSFQAGTKNIVGIGGTAFTDKQVELLRRICESVVLALDADYAGDAAARRGIEMADKAGLMVKIVEPLDKYKDPGDWATADAYGWSRAVAEAVPVYDFYIKSAVKRHGLDVAGKKKIGSELIPILAKIEDEIVKAHYIAKLAEILKVREDDVRVQLGKAQIPRSPAERDPALQDKNPESKDNSESFAIEMAIKCNKILELERAQTWFQDPFWSKVVNLLVANPDIKALPAEVSPRVFDLTLRPRELDDNSWELALKRLETDHLRTLIQAGGEAADMKVWTRRLGELTKDR